MGDPQDQRRWPRKTLPSPDICFLNFEDMMRESKVALDELSGSSLYVDICDVSQGGVLIKSEKKIESDSLLSLNIYNSSDRLWNFFQGNVKWIKSDASQPDYYQIGVEILPHDLKTKPIESWQVAYKQRPLPADFEFFRNYV